MGSEAISEHLICMGEHTPRFPSMCALTPILMSSASVAVIAAMLFNACLSCDKTSYTLVFSLAALVSLPVLGFSGAPSSYAFAHSPCMLKQIPLMLTQLVTICFSLSLFSIYSISAHCQALFLSHCHSSPCS